MPRSSGAPIFLTPSVVAIVRLLRVAPRAGPEPIRGGRGGQPPLPRRSCVPHDAAIEPWRGGLLRANGSKGTGRRFTTTRRVAQGQGRDAPMFLLLQSTHRMVVRYHPEIGHLFLPNLK